MKKILAMMMCAIILFMPVSFVHALKITNVNSDTTDNSAIITWKTDSGSNSSVEYSLQSLSSRKNDPRSVIDHTIKIENLVGGTKYSYKVTSCSGTCNSSDLLNFTTKADKTAPTINANLPARYNKDTISIDVSSEPLANIELFVNEKTSAKKDADALGNAKFIDVKLAANAQNKVKIVAIDAAKNKGEKTYDINIDTKPPTIKLDNILGGYPKSTIPINGTTDEDVNALYYTSYKGAPYVLVLNKSYTKDIKENLALSNGDGDYSVKILFFDKGDNQFAKTFTTSIDGAAPTLTVDTNSISNNVFVDQVVINGNTKPGATVVVFVNDETTSNKAWTTDMLSMIQKFGRIVQGEKSYSTVAKADGTFSMKVYLSKQIVQRRSDITVPNANLPTQQTTFDIAGWENNLKIVAVDRYGRSSNAIEKKILYAMCDAGNGDWNLKFDVKPNAIQPDLVRNSMGAIYLNYRLEWQGAPTDKIDVTAPSILVPSDLMSYGFNKEDSEFSSRLVSRNPISQFDPMLRVGSSYVTLKSWSGAEEEFKKYSKVPIVFIIDLPYTFQRQNGYGTTEQYKQKFCVPATIMLDRSLDLGKLPSGLLKATTDVMDGINTGIKAVHSVTKVLQPVLFATSFALYIYSKIMEFKTRLGCSSYISSNFLPVDSSKKFVTSDKCDTLGEKKEIDACTTCWQAHFDYKNAERLFKMSGDRIFCPAIPKIQEYLRTESGKDYYVHYEGKDDSQNLTSTKISACAVPGTDGFPSTEQMGTKMGYKTNPTDACKSELNFEWGTACPGVANIPERMLEINIANTTNPLNQFVDTTSNICSTKDTMTEQVVQWTLCKSGFERSTWGYVSPELVDSMALGTTATSEDKKKKIDEGKVIQAPSNDYNYVPSQLQFCDEARIKTKDCSIINQMVVQTEKDKDLVSSVNYIPLKGHCLYVVNPKGRGEGIYRAEVPMDTCYRDDNNQCKRDAKGNILLQTGTSFTAKVLDKLSDNEIELLRLKDRMTNNPYAIEPYDGLFNSARCACLPAFNGYLMQYSQILDATSTCLKSSKSGNEFRSAVCKDRMTVYICDLIYAALKCVTSFASETFGRQDTGIAGFFSVLSGSGRDIGNTVQSRYGGTSMFRAMFVEKRLYHAACVAAFGGDWDADLTGILTGSTNVIPLNSEATAYGSRKYITSNPVTGKTTYTYKVGYQIYAGATLTYSVKLLCSSDISCGSPDNPGAECDCSRKGKSEQITVASGILRSGDVLDQVTPIMVDGSGRYYNGVRYDKVIMTYSYRDNKNVYKTETVGPYPILEEGSESALLGCSFDIGALEFLCQSDESKQGYARFSETPKPTKSTYYVGDSLDFTGKIYRKNGENDRRFYLTYNVYKATATGTRGDLLKDGSIEVGSQRQSYDMATDFQSGWPHFIIDGTTVSGLGTGQMTKSTNVNSGLTARINSGNLKSRLDIRVVTNTDGKDYVTFTYGGKYKITCGSDTLTPKDSKGNVIEDACIFQQGTSITLTTIGSSDDPLVITLSGTPALKSTSTTGYDDTLVFQPAASSTARLIAVIGLHPSQQSNPSLYDPTPVTVSMQEQEFTYDIAIDLTQSSSKDNRCPTDKTLVALGYMCICGDGTFTNCPAVFGAKQYNFCWGVCRQYQRCIIDGITQNEADCVCDTITGPSSTDCGGASSKGKYCGPQGQGGNYVCSTTPVATTPTTTPATGGNPQSVLVKMQSTSENGETYYQMVQDAANDIDFGGLGYTIDNKNKIAMVMATISIECSSVDKNCKNPDSTATGLGQFIASTAFSTKVTIGGKNYNLCSDKQCSVLNEDYRRDPKSSIYGILQLYEIEHENLKKCGYMPPTPEDAIRVAVISYHLGSSKACKAVDTAGKSANAKQVLDALVSDEVDGSGTSHSNTYAPKWYSNYNYYLGVIV